MQIQRLIGPDEINPAKAASLTRYVSVLGKSGTGVREMLQQAEIQRARPEVVDAIKAAVSPGTLASADWANAAAATDVLSAEFLESIARESLLMHLTGMGGAAPIDTRLVVSTTTGAAAATITEGSAIPVTAMALQGQKLETTLTGAIAVFSKELLDQTSGTGFAFLRNELQAAVIAASNEAVLDIALDSVTPVAATANILADLRGLLNSVNVKGSGSLVFATDTTTQNVLLTSGLREAEQLNPRGGFLFGVPVIVSDEVDAGAIHLLDANAFIGYQGALTVDKSTAGSIQLDDAPDAGPAALVSLWQQNLIGFRILHRFGLLKVRASGAASLTGAAAAWSA